MKTKKFLSACFLAIACSIIIGCYAIITNFVNKQLTQIKTITIVSVRADTEIKYFENTRGIIDPDTIVNFYEVIYVDENGHKSDWTKCPKPPKPQIGKTKAYFYNDEIVWQTSLE